MKDQELFLEVEELEERIAPSATGNPGNEGTGGKVSTGP